MAVQCPVEGELWKVCQGGICLQLSCWRGAKIEGLPWIYCQPWSTNTGDFAGLRTWTNACCIEVFCWCPWIEVMRRMPSFREPLSESKHYADWLCLQTKFGLHNDWSLLSSIPILLDKCTVGRFGRVRTYCNLEYNRCVKLHGRSLTLVVRGTCCTPSRPEILLFRWRW